MKNKRWLYHDKIGFVCLFLMILTLAISITINFRPLYLFDIGYLNITENYPIDKMSLVKNYDQLMAYLNVPFISTLKLTDFPVSKSGAMHFFEVKRLFLVCYGVLFLTSIPSVLFLRNLSKQQCLWKLIRPFQLGMIGPIVLGITALMGFDQFFVLFHKVLFYNDDWLFNPVTDPIIEVLPEAFFMHSFLLFFLLFEGFMLIGLIIGKKSLKK